MQEGVKVMLLSAGRDRILLRYPQWILNEHNDVVDEGPTSYHGVRTFGQLVTTSPQ